MTTDATQTNPLWFSHPSKFTADRVAAELRHVGWKTAVTTVGSQFRVSYWREHHRKGEQS